MQRHQHGEPDSSESDVLRIVKMLCFLLMLMAVALWLIAASYLKKYTVLEAKYKELSACHCQR